MVEKQMFDFRGVEYDAERDLTMAAPISRWRTIREQLGFGLDMKLKDGSDAPLEEQILVLGYLAARVAGDSSSTFEALADEVNLSMLRTVEVEAESDPT